MPALLSGKVAVITGASMGLGEALARLFAEEGAAVVMVSRDQGRIEAARSRVGHPERTLALTCDVRNREEIDRVLSLTLHNLGRVDIWVNNAGYGMNDSVEQMDRDAYRRMFDTNLFGAIDGMQAAIPAMKRQGGGTIINMSSVAGHIALPFAGAYSATKFAMNAIGKAAGVELAGSGVRVMTVCPGYIDTDFSRNKAPGHDPRSLNSESRSGASAETVARDILNGYLKGKREVFTPWHYWLVAKMYQLFPGLVEWGMARKLKSSR